MSQREHKLKMLAEVQKAFTEWRAKKTHPSQPIPEELWQRAIDLLPAFSQTRVSVALNLSGAEFKRRAQEAGVLIDQPKGKKKTTRKKREPVHQQEFVELKIPSGQAFPQVEERSSCSGWKLMLTRRDGACLEIQPADFNEHQMRAFVHDFLGG